MAKNILLKEKIVFKSFLNDFFYLNKHFYSNEFRLRRNKLMHLRKCFKKHFLLAPLFLLFP